MNICALTLIFLQNAPVDFFAQGYSCCRRLYQKWLINMQKLAPNGLLADGPNKLKTRKYFDPFLATIIQFPHCTILPSL